MSGKVSIIIPVYKVEKYIDRCINSIVNQTYRNLEIIVVNDGSPDNCGEMADRYAKQDQRIKVCHKPNGGLSDARNYGMQFISGDFTLFVDSDDWLDETMIEKVMDVMNKYQADVVQSAFYYAYDSRLLFDDRYCPAASPPLLMDNKTLMKELLKGEKVKNFAWGKLFRTELIRNIPFKKGVLFEDVFWTYKVFHQVNRYVVLHAPLCYYYQREDSIVAAHTHKSLDILTGMKERHRFLEVHYENLVNDSFKGILKESFIQHNLLALNRVQDPKGIEKKKIVTYVKNHKNELMKAVSADRELKTQLFLFSIHPFINIGYLILRKVLRKLNVISRPTGLAVMAVRQGGREDEESNQYASGFS